MLLRATAITFSILSTLHGPPLFRYLLVRRGWLDVEVCSLYASGLVSGAAVGPEGGWEAGRLILGNSRGIVITSVGSMTDGPWPITRFRSEQTSSVRR
jgi:hypothetical protein